MTDREPVVSEAQARAALAQERAEIQARMADLTHDFEGIVAASQDVSTDDEHDPDGATIAYERAQVRALLGQARRHLADLDRAEERLAEGSYGTCERCGQPIGAARLEARPAARTCIDCASLAP
jgi:RNA polymerase-binding protein DksA